MPAYISHAIMANDAFNRAAKDRRIFKTDVCCESLKTYSLGVDLSLSVKGLDAHNQNTQAFLMNMIKYINDNKLKSNPEIMSFLYGHVFHYFFDTNVHPFINYYSQSCQNVGFINAHNLIEGYLSSYLASRVLKTDIMKIDASFFARADISDPKVNECIDLVYYKTYKRSFVVNGYKKVLAFFVAVEKLSKSGIFNKKTLISLSKFREFLSKNHLDLSDLTNENRELFLNPVTGKKHFESFMDLYERSIEMSLDAIIKINRYLYGNASLSSLEKVFPNLSYDTGCATNLGKKYAYVKQIKR